MTADQEARAAEKRRLIVAIGNGDDSVEAQKLAAIVLEELARREAERAERMKPIDAKWLESIGAYHEWNHGGDAGWYGIEIDDDEWLSVSGATGLTHIVMCDGVKQIERRFDTRGQLLDILAALKGDAT